MHVVTATTQAGVINHGKSLFSAVDYHEVDALDIVGFNDFLAALPRLADNEVAAAMVTPQQLTVIKDEYGVVND
jgi:hypothetical protein